MHRDEAPVGIHHVTGTAGDAQANVDFYAGTLGLSWLVRTVNFEDVLTPHLYYGDPSGRPGSVLTFFPFGETDPGRVGPPQPTAVALAVPEGSLPDWTERLERRGVDIGGRSDRFGERVLSFPDPNGTRVELVETSRVEAEGEAETRIRGIDGVTLQSVNPYATAAVLETLGFDRADQEDDRIRYRGTADVGRVVDVVDREGEFGREGPGTLHHVALRVPDLDALYAWHDRFRDRDAEVSRVKDRHFFHSLYIREPGGILFELATEAPGLARAADHDPGDSIYLPERFAHQRDLVERQHPEFIAPTEPVGR
ncbi:VOC family protein [Halobacteria archaeon AArc-dxtr1]|nr:VOC family protein [Halobacteria archaeon AArc-dxtr1]